MSLRLWMQMEKGVKEELEAQGRDWEQEFAALITGVKTLSVHELERIAGADRTVPPVVIERKLTR